MNSFILNIERFSADKNQAHYHVLIRKDIFAIGSSLENDLPLEDPKVSKKHCQLKFQNNEWLIQDLNSTNGTYINNSRLEANELKLLGESDTIQLGSHKLSIRTYNLNVTNKPTQLVAPADSLQTNQVLELLANSAIQDRIKLEIRYRKKLIREMILTGDSGHWIIGRHEAADIQIDSSQVSRRHASITACEDGSYLLTDLKSSNGVTINGSILDSECQLKGDDEIGIGNHKIIFRDSEIQSAPINKVTEPEKKCKPFSRRTGSAMEYFLFSVAVTSSILAIALLVWSLFK